MHEFMRRTTRKILEYYINKMPLSGRVLEIGGHKLSKCAIKHFPENQFKYFDLNLKNLILKIQLFQILQTVKMKFQTNLLILFFLQMFLNIFSDHGLQQKRFLEFLSLGELFLLLLCGLGETTLVLLIIGDFHQSV